MRVYVTGITGFIGSHLLTRLAASPHEYTCLVRSQAAADRVRAAGVTPSLGDVTDKASLLKGMASHDVVVNLANVYSYWEPDPTIYHRVNVAGTRNVMEAALETNISRVVHISSILVYGPTPATPVNEEYAGAPPLSEYARTKAVGDQIAWDLYQTRNLPLVVLYPAGVTGPGDPKVTGAMLIDFMNGRLPGLPACSTIVSQVDVRDVAATILTAIDKPDILGERYIIAAEHVTMGSLYKMAADLTGLPLPAMKMPDWMFMASAQVMTAISSITKRPPMLSLATDFARTLTQHFSFDGSKAAREFGLAYMPLRQSYADAIAEIRRLGLAK